MVAEGQITWLFIDVLLLSWIHCIEKNLQILVIIGLIGAKIWSVSEGLAVLLSDGPNVSHPYLWTHYLRDLLTRWWTPTCPRVLGEGSLYKVVSCDIWLTILDRNLHLHTVIYFTVTFFSFVYFVSIFIQSLPSPSSSLFWWEIDKRVVWGAGFD